MQTQIDPEIVMLEEYNVRPYFITFEGGEGCGKTTQVKKLYDFFQHMEIPAISTREPGGVAASERIRDIVLDINLNLDSYTDLLLFQAARVEFIQKVVRPNLNEGISVICDRFADSTMAYQGYGSGIPKHKVTMLDNIVLGNLRPDLTFVIDIDPEVGLKNATRRGELSRFDAMKLDYHKRVNAGFREIATKKENRDRCVLIKYEDGEDVVFNKVREEFMHRLFRELES